MSGLRSLTVLAMRSGATADEEPPEAGCTLVDARGGESLGRRDRVRLWAFLSPTEAVLAGLDACAEAAGAGVAVGISLGEVSGEGDGVEGEPVDLARALARGARPGWVYISESAKLAVNHNEVESRPAAMVEAERGQVQAFRARRGGRREKGGAAPAQISSPTVPPHRGGSGPSGRLHASGGFASLTVGCLLGLVLGYWATGVPDPFERARKAQLRGESDHAIEQAFLAWRHDAGRPELVALLRRLHLDAVDRFMKAERPDRALLVLRRVRKILPFDDELEGSLFRTGAAQIRAWALAGRDGAAQEEEARLAAELPARAAELRKVYYGARMDGLEAEMKPFLASGKRVSYERLREWSERVDMVAEDFPDWGRVHYLWGRLALANQRFEDMGKHYMDALRADARFSENRQIFEDVMRAAESVSSHRSLQTLTQARKVLSEGLKDWVLPLLTERLNTRHSVVRIVSYAALEARGALPEKGLLDHHLMNLGLEASSTEKGCAADARCLLSGLDYLAGLRSLEDVTRARRALESMPAEARKDDGVRKRAGEVLEMLRGRSG